MISPADYLVWYAMWMAATILMAVITVRLLKAGVDIATAIIMAIVDGFIVIMSIILTCGALQICLRS